MKKMTDKKFLTMFFMLMFIVTSNINIAKVKAETTSSASQTISNTSYISLGDSISYGMSAATGKGYVDLFYTHLGTVSKYGKVELQNLSIPGDKSSDLLAKLQTTNYQDAVKNAKVITISIGGNNLLSPVIAAVCQGFGVNPVNNPNYTTELATTMASNPNKATILAEIANSPTLVQALKTGVLQFNNDFPNIIKEIKKLAPESEVYILTLYNPFNANDPLYSVFDPLINTINTIIKSQTTDYKVADVYEKFKTTSGAVNFSLANMMLDPHPTTVGHAAIYQAIIDAEIKDNQIVVANKKWTIIFTGDVGYDDLTKNAIIVTDSKDNKINTTLELGQDGKSIIVYSPTTGYIPGESYTLTIGKQSHSKSGKQMKQDRVLHFSVEKDTIN